MLGGVGASSRPTAPRRDHPALPDETSDEESMAETRLLFAAALFGMAAACGRSAPSRSPNGEPPMAQNVSVEVRPGRIAVLPGETVDFTSLVTGTADPSVVWEVVEPGGGTVSTTGIYVAPQVTGDYTVRASSKLSSSAVGVAKVRVGHVSVAVSPTAVTVGAGGTVSFTAKVNGTKNTSVSWSIREPSACGTIAPSGVYAAPGSAAVCHIDATSVVDPSAIAESSVTVVVPPAPPPVTVTITPASPTVDACQTLAFTATVSGSSIGAVSWTVQEGAAGGAISSSGIYTAPSVAGTYHVVATSQAAPGASAAVAIAVADRILGVTVSPTTVALAPGATAQFTATVTTTCGSTTSTQIVAAP
jgi:hypothetical protein